MPGGRGCFSSEKKEQVIMTEAMRPKLLTLPLDNAPVERGTKRLKQLSNNTGATANAPEPSNNAPVRRGRGTKRLKQLPDDTGATANAQEPSDNTLSEENMVKEVLKMITSREKAQLMIISLMAKYKFNLSLLKELLLAHKIDASFSKILYSEIAPTVGLDPIRGGIDIPTFEMHRARLPHSTCYDILMDLKALTFQYGTAEFHRNEEATSRWVSGHFNRILPLFFGALLNTPEVLLESDITKSGRIEYQYTVEGGISILFIGVKLTLGNRRERLECIGQVIAESIACSFTNRQNGFNLPILGILCDGEQFNFFEFQKKGTGQAGQFRLGVFPDGSKRVATANPSSLDSNFNTQQAVLQIRSVCEALYYCFLRAYSTGLGAFWHRSLEKSRSEGKTRDSTPKWGHAVTLSTQALNEALAARVQYERGELDASQETAESAVRTLSQSVNEAPIQKHEYLPDFTPDMLEK
ncbi:hypothetical protein Egran_04603 [Elaphomyces granulatus]|uniref:Uncharacterized protein n=1 Tax=Elaphomyces granulatus TaxID=519963 RepID=A0A232LU27_9EURO|nr:hypothetical protein Egran_04603 [Elaphomyces granulatus]